MNPKKNCSVILDLLPLYTEGLLRPDTEETVAEHLKHCDACRAAYEGLKQDDGIPAPREERLQETAPLRKFRFHLLMNILGFPLWLPLLLAGIVVCFALWISLVAVLLSLWCIPFSSICISLASIPTLILSLMGGLTGNIPFSIGCLLAGFGLAVVSAYLCEKLTVLFFRGTGWLLKKIFPRKKRKTKGTETK